MKNLRTIAATLLAVALSASFSACSDDDGGSNSLSETKARKTLLGSWQGETARSVSDDGYDVETYTVFTFEDHAASVATFRTTYRSGTTKREEESTPYNSWQIDAATGTDYSSGTLILRLTNSNERYLYRNLRSNSVELSPASKEGWFTLTKLSKGK